MSSRQQFRRRVTELVNDALEVGAESRDAFLADACGDDPDLRQEVESLLAEEAALAADFLEVPAALELTDLDTTDPDRDDGSAAGSEIPERLGPYRVLGLLGRGGMGTVYLGEQEEPVHRRVALKVIDAVTHRGARERFAAECEALARLSHPNIAALYEVGATGQGLPYVVMELVEGDQITTWCDEYRLSLEARLELFSAVCAGVRHAHEKGLLHRDLKPSNLLVTQVDGRPVPKVIDFGIARALDAPRAGGNRLTQGLLLGSPAYMSPEAADAESGREVDTRSDVYSLGLVLYELLVGELPYDSSGDALPVLLQRSRQEELPAPSRRFRHLAVGRQIEISARRGLDRTALARHLRGDLDAIVLKAGAHDREQRYSSPADLAADLQRHLRRQPVTARPPATTYLLGRFLRRRLGIVAAVTLLFLALIGGIVARSLEARRARRSAAEAQAVTRFLVDLFEIADPDRTSDVTARELLDQGAERVHSDLVQQPLIRAHFAQAIGEIYTNLALFEPAEKMVRTALELRRNQLPPNHPEVLESMSQLGVILRRQGRYDEAEPLLRRVLAARETGSDRDPVALALSLNNLGNLLWAQNEVEEAEQAYRRAIEIRDRELGSTHPDLADTVNNLGVLLMSRGRDREAAPLLQQAAEIYLATLGNDNPRCAATFNNLALVQRNLGQWQEAEHNLRRAERIWEVAYGADHPRTVMARSSLGSLLVKQGREEEAVQLYRDILRRQEAAGRDDLEIATTLSRLGIALGYLGDLATAKEVFLRVLQIRSAVHGAEHPSIVNVHSNLAWLAWRGGRFAEAEAGHRTVLEIRERIRGSEHPKTAWTLHHLALAVAGQGRNQEAVPLLERALAIRRQAFGASHPDVAATLHELGLIKARLGDLKRARQLLEQALAIRAQILPDGHRDLTASREAVAALP